MFAKTHEEVWHCTNIRTIHYLPTKTRRIFPLWSSPAILSGHHEFENLSPNSHGKTFSSWSAGRAIRKSAPTIGTNNWNPKVARRLSHTFSRLPTQQLAPIFEKNNRFRSLNCFLTLIDGEVAIVRQNQSSIFLRTRSADFARKLIRPFGAVTGEDIENEARAITKPYGYRAMRNIIDVWRHGWLPGASVYYIEMELCSMTLATHIELSNRHNSVNSDANLSGISLAADRILSFPS